MSSRNVDSQLISNGILNVYVIIVVCKVKLSGAGGKSYISDVSCITFIGWDLLVVALLKPV